MRMATNNEPDETTEEEAAPPVVEDETVPDTRSRSEQWDAFATYSVEENGVTYRIIPQFTSTATRWTLWIFGSGQGPIQRPNGITDEIADHLGLSRSTQEALNATLQKAKEDLELPREFRGQPRGKRSIQELQATLGVE